MEKIQLAAILGFSLNQDWIFSAPFNFPKLLIGLSICGTQPMPHFTPIKPQGQGVITVQLLTDLYLKQDMLESVSCTINFHR